MALNNYDMLTDNGFDVEKTLKTKTVLEFDDTLTKHINKCDNLQDFYTKANCKPTIKDIAVPTLFIHSLDDPICIKEVIPYDEINKNENCMMIVTPKGGHIEWFTGTQPERWAYKPTLEFLSYQAKKFGDD